MLPASISVREYFALASECRTQNQFNKLHIHFENILAPSELAQFRNMSQEHRFSEQSRSWLQKLQLLSPDLFDAPRFFVRKHLSEQILLYSDPNHLPQDKTLLVCFSGNARRLMLPISVFLQCLDPQTIDVVLLRKGEDKRPYLAGLQGICNSFVELLEHIDALVPAHPYHRTITLGTSSGGFPALMAALAMDAARGVSICGALLPEQRQSQSSTRQETEIVLVHGAEFAPDHDSAQAIRAIYGGSLCPIAGVSEHNVLNALRARGELARFLETILA